MKWLIIFLVIVGLLLFFIYPPVNSERVCYERAQTGLDMIASQVLSRNLPVQSQCSERQDMLYTLESCIEDATRSSTIAIYANDTIQRIVGIIRPYAPSLWTLKADHNQQCVDFPWYQL